MLNLAESFDGNTVPGGSCPRVPVKQAFASLAVYALNPSP